MRGLNKVMLIGNVGGDPEVRTTGGGSTVANFSMATTRQWMNEAGQKQEATQWHRVVVWAGLAETVGKYVTKGMRVYVEGAVEYRKWEDKDGVTRYSTEINAREVLFMGGGRDTRQSNAGNGQTNAPPKEAAAEGDDYPNGYPPDWDEPPAKKPAAKKSAGKRAGAR